MEGIAGEEGAECVHRTGGTERVCLDAGPLIVADIGALAGCDWVGGEMYE